MRGSGSLFHNLECYKSIAVHCAGLLTPTELKVLCGIVDDVPSHHSHSELYTVPFSVNLKFLIYDVILLESSAPIIFL